MALLVAAMLAASPVPVLVELFTSEGCSSCPPADALFTERQQDYAPVVARGRVYTPQMVVGGRVDVLGSDESAARSAVARAAAEPHGTLRLERRGKGVRIAARDLPAHAEAQVLLAVVEDGLSNRVLRGENQGRTLSHSAVVRSLRRIGIAAGPSFELDVQPALDPSWKSPRLVAFVQEERSRKVLAAAELGP